MDLYTALLCRLSRLTGMRQLLIRTPMLWRLDKIFRAALARARLCTLSQLPRRSICAELGSWKGDFAAQILQVTTPQRLHLVDPWMGSLQQDATAFGHLEPQSEWDHVYRSVVARFRECPAVTIHRMTSTEFLTGIAAGSLDWVYIDGDHSEHAVAEDLRLAWIAIKPLGYLVGDDYDWQDEAGRYTVKAAVDAFCRRIDVTPTMIASQFMIRKPN